MPRLLSWPLGLQANFREPLSGPRTVGGGKSENLGGFVQTVGTPFGLWRWRFSFPPLRGEKFRRYRGWVTALHGGANATRVPWCDWDGLTAAQRGIQATPDQLRAGVPWSNGRPWGNGRNWGVGTPKVTLAEDAGKGSTELRLVDAFWGWGLDYGDVMGVGPMYFGWHMVTERFGSGRYRIWPPLRKAAKAGDFATLTPVMAMRLEGEEAASAGRGAAFAEGLSITLVEVPDTTVARYFTA